MEMLVQKLLASVPTYTRYLTLEQICRQTDALRNQPGFTIETIGQSAKGMPIAMIRYDGGYDRTVLLWGFEDPTEPVGALSVFWLGGQLRRRNPQLMRFQCNWAIIPTINPDGVKRNEGWFRAPGDLHAFLHGAWEPPYEQVLGIHRQRVRRWLRYVRQSPHSDLMYCTICTMKAISPHQVTRSFFHRQLMMNRYKRDLCREVASLPAKGFPLRTAREFATAQFSGKTFWHRNAEPHPRFRSSDARSVSSTMLSVSNCLSPVNGRLCKGRFLWCDSLAFPRFRATATCGRGAPVRARNPP
jgi:hypothetical protein